MSLLSSSCGKGTGNTPINFLYVHMSILPMGSPQCGWRRPCGGGSAVGACPPYSLTPGDLEWSPDIKCRNSYSYNSVSFTHARALTFLLGLPV